MERKRVWSNNCSRRVEQCGGHRSRLLPQSGAAGRRSGGRVGQKRLWPGHYSCRIKQFRRHRRWRRSPSGTARRRDSGRVGWSTYGQASFPLALGANGTVTAWSCNDHGQTIVPYSGVVRVSSRGGICGVIMASQSLLHRFLDLSLEGGGDAGVGFLKVGPGGGVSHATGAEYPADFGLNILQAGTG